MIRFLPLVLLAGCAETVYQDRIVPVEVAVPKSSPCVPVELDAAPDYPDTAEALRAATPAVRYNLVIAGRLLRIARLAELEPVVAGCPRG